MRVPVALARALLICALALLPGACLRSGAEHQLLDRFFAASRLRDRTALARLATVTFEPDTDGLVSGFSIRSARNLDPDHRELIVDVSLIANPTADHVTLQVTLTRQTTTGLQPDGTRQWMVTAFTRVPASRTSPAASSSQP